MSVELRLIVAGFERALARRDPDHRLPMLERWLARGAQRIAATSGHRAPVARWQAMLLESIDPLLEPADFASAPVSWLGLDGAAFDGICLHADPVHIETLMDRLRLADRGSPEAAEALALGHDLSSALDAARYRFAARAPGRWFIRVPGPLEARTIPLEAALGTDLRETLPTGDDAPLLHRLMNEAQMLLHTHEVNVARERATRPPVNGLWLWGEGACPTRELPSATRLFGDDPYVSGLARLQGHLAAPAAATRSAVIDSDASCTAVAVRIGQLDDLERDWLVPLTDDLRSGRYARVVLGLESRWVAVSGRSLRRFWKRDRGLSEWPG
jgi:hypothetical protein